MKYYPKKHHRRSIRLKGYNYSNAGLYSITICTQNRVCLFGYIENGQMKLNAAGQMVEKWYRELENKYPDKRCYEMIIMPNHFHCIIENIPLDVCCLDADLATSLRGRPNNEFPDDFNSGNNYGIDKKKYNSTIGDAMDWFKTMTTNEYITS